jgi:hypothetical protein
MRELETSLRQFGQFVLKAETPVRPHRRQAAKGMISTSADVLTLDSNSSTFANTASAMTSSLHLSH